MGLPVTTFSEIYINSTKKRFLDDIGQEVSGQLLSDTLFIPASSYDVEWQKS